MESATIYEAIEALADYGIDCGLIGPEDKIYVTNQWLELLSLEDYQLGRGSRNMDLEEILALLLDYACEKGIIEDNITARDLFDTSLMNVLVPKPGEVIREFTKRRQISSREATDYYFKLSQDSNYIRRYRIKKDRKWTVETEYGILDITINLSKPEKDPKTIAAAKLAKQSGYPKCLLCKENEGYAGHINHPARQNHRIIPLTINGQSWGFQYSPYAYYNEHCIVFNGEHTPMQIDRAAFRKLFNFVRQFPHYFVGSNADLPIVGGSILSHDHFQGGNYSFAMARAEVEETFTIPGFEDIKAGIVKWPMSVIRLRATDDSRLVELGDHILTAWRNYTDKKALIYANTDGEPHNTITPIARWTEGSYELDLVLRNNLTTKEHPLGLYHPHAELHHIKKENIGLIEVMGLAVLPTRLKEEMDLLEQYLIEEKDIRSNEALQKHADWAEAIKRKYPYMKKEEIGGILEQEIGFVFCEVLEHAGVYKRDEDGREAFRRFIRGLS